MRAGSDASPRVWAARAQRRNVTAPGTQGRRVASCTSTCSGDSALAVKEYEAVGQQANSPYFGLAMLRLGDIQWGAGNKEKAQEYYEKIKKNPSMTGNPAREEAEQRLEKSLKMKPPTLVANS